MAVRSYVVVPESGRRDEVSRALAGVPGCSVCPADNADLVLLVTETPDPDADAALDARLAAIPGIHTMTLAFGELDPGSMR